MHTYGNNIAGLTAKNHLDVTICFFCEEYANNNVYSADGTLFFMSIEI
jgi:hypothetical protein